MSPKFSGKGTHPKPGYVPKITKPAAASSRAQRHPERPCHPERQRRILLQDSSLSFIMTHKMVIYCILAVNRYPNAVLFNIMFLWFQLLKSGCLNQKAA